MDEDDAPPTGDVRLRAPAHRVSPRAQWMWASEAVVQLALLGAAQVIWWQVDARGSRTPHLVVAVITGVLGLAYAVGMPLWRYRVHRWETSATAVYTQTGWLNLERRIAPISRVQTVDLTRGPFAQLLGLSTVRVTTASAAGPLVIHGLAQDVAAGLVEALTRAAEAERGDAT